MAFNINFDFMIKPWWIDEIYDYNLDKRKEKMVVDINKINEFMIREDNKEFIEGYIYYRFISDYLECEHDINIKIDKITDILENNENSGSFKTDNKILNLYKILKKLFQPNLQYTSNISKYLIIDYCKKLHKNIGEQIIDNSGNFRIKFSKPAGYDLEYLHPSHIEKELGKLFITLNNSLKRYNNIFDIIKITACFVKRFLFIHPFSNGNGRLARIYASLILRHITNTPISLYINNESRGYYLKAINECQIDNSHPIALASYILDSVYINNRNIINSLDLECD